VNRVAWNDVSVYQKHTMTSILSTLKVHQWKYAVHNTPASHCSLNSCFTILCTDVLEIPVDWL